MVIGIDHAHGRIETRNDRRCGAVDDIAGAIDYSDGRIDIEDVKGMKLPIYNLKKKIVEAMYNIKIIEK